MKNYTAGLSRAKARFSSAAFCTPQTAGMDGKENCIHVKSPRTHAGRNRRPQKIRSGARGRRRDMFNRYKKKILVIWFWLEENIAYVGNRSASRNTPGKEYFARAQTPLFSIPEPCGRIKMLVYGMQLKEKKKKNLMWDIYTSPLRGRDSRVLISFSPLPPRPVDFIPSKTDQESPPSSLTPHHPHPHNCFLFSDYVESEQRNSRRLSAPPSPRGGILEVF